MRSPCGTGEAGRTADLRGVAGPVVDEELMDDIEITSLGNAFFRFVPEEAPSATFRCRLFSDSAEVINFG